MANAKRYYTSVDFDDFHGLNLCVDIQISYEAEDCIQINSIKIEEITDLRGKLVKLPEHLTHELLAKITLQTKSFEEDIVDYLAELDELKESRKEEYYDHKRREKRET